jgi:hypothetical protein
MLFLVHRCCTFSVLLRNIGNETYLRAVFGFWRSFHQLRGQSTTKLCSDSPIHHDDHILTTTGMSHLKKLEYLNFSLLRCQMKSEGDDVRRVFKNLAPYLATGQLSLQLYIREVSV